MTVLDFLAIVVFVVVGTISAFVLGPLQNWVLAAKTLPVRLLSILLASTATSAFIVFEIVDELVMAPAQLQREVLGRELVSPRSLVAVAWFPVIMDPWQTWTYKLNSDQSAWFRANCTSNMAIDKARCFIGREGPNDFTDFKIVGDRLEVTDGLH